MGVVTGLKEIGGSEPTINMMAKSQSGKMERSPPARSAPSASAAPDSDLGNHAE